MQTIALSMQCGEASQLQRTDKYVAFGLRVLTPGGLDKE